MCVTNSDYARHVGRGERRLRPRAAHPHIFRRHFITYLICPCLRFATQPVVKAERGTIRDEIRKHVW